MDLPVSILLGEGETAAVIRFGRTRSAHRVLNVTPPALRLLEGDGYLLIEWGTSSHARRVRVDLRSWGAPLALTEVEGLTPKALLARLEGEVSISFEPLTLEEWRRDAAAAASAHHLARDFFNALDSSTSAWSEARDNLQALLRAYYEQRWGGVDDPTALSSPSIELLDELRVTAQLFTNLFAPFGDIEEIRDAFDLFARGELSLLGSTVPLPTGVKPEEVALACQPDSDFYYLFAELAQACIHHGIGSVGKFSSPGVWVDLLSTLVHSHKLFCKAYGKAYGTDWKFNSSLPTTGIAPPGRSVADIRAERGLALATLAAQSVLSAWASQLRADVIVV